MPIEGGPYIERDSTLSLQLDAADLNSFISGSTIWNNLVTNANTSSLVNGPGYTSDFGNGVVFDGSNDYCALPAVVNTNADFTVEIIFSISSQKINTLLAGWDNSTYFQIRTTASNTIEILRAKAVSMGVFSNSTVSLTIPWFLTITRSGNTYTLYLNGNFRSSITSTQTFAVSGPALGINQNAEYLTGTIYTFKFYSKILSAQQIKDNYEVQRSRFGL